MRRWQTSNQTASVEEPKINRTIGPFQISRYLSNQIKIHSFAGLTTLLLAGCATSSEITPNTKDDTSSALNDSPAHELMIDKFGKTELDYILEEKSPGHAGIIFGKHLSDPTMALRGKMPEDLYKGLVIDKDLESIKAAINNGADINSVDLLGRNALHHAIFQRDIDLARWLVSQGIDELKRDLNGFFEKEAKTPLCYAAQSGSFDEGIKLLTQNSEAVNAGCDPDNRGDYTDTPLTFAVREPVHSLMSRNHPVKSGVKQAKLLLDAGAEPSPSLGQGSQSPIQLAVVNGNLKMVELLLNAGADVWDRDYNGQNVLHYAAQGGRASILSRLVEQPGAENAVNIESNDPAGLTPLHFAAGNTAVNGKWISSESRHREQDSTALSMVIGIVGNGADVNKQTAAGDTPLHFAVRSRNLYVIAYLTSLPKTDLSLVNNKGKTAYQECSDWHKKFPDCEMVKKAFQVGISRKQ